MLSPCPLDLDHLINNQSMPQPGHNTTNTCINGKKGPISALQTSTGKGTYSNTHTHLQAICPVFVPAVFIFVVLRKDCQMWNLALKIKLSPFVIIFFEYFDATSYWQLLSSVCSVMDDFKMCNSISSDIKSLFNYDDMCINFLQ